MNQLLNDVLMKVCGACKEKQFRISSLDFESN